MLKIKAQDEIRKTLASFVGVSSGVNTFLTERMEETLSGNCVCQVSKDMDDRPLSVPKNLKLVDYYFFHTTITFPADLFSKHLSPSNLRSSTEDYIFLKAANSTVLLV